jgi:P pilus assembly protein, chaperone PapD
VNTRRAKSWFAVSIIGALSLSASAMAADSGGVGLGATRVIYNEGDAQISLSVRNTSKTVPYLIQAWVMTPDNKKTQDFITTPPLFVLNTASENLLRIMYVGPALPKDRESLFYASVRAVPSTTKKEEGSVLKIATQSVIKLFWRPKGLSISVNQAAEKLRCDWSGQSVTVHNPTPYYITLTGLTLGGKGVKNQMVSPLGSFRFDVPKGAVNQTVSYRTINDYGAETPSMTCKS